MLTKSKPFQQILCENNVFKSSAKIFKSQCPTTPAPKAEENVSENITNKASMCRRQLVDGNKNCFKVLRKINYVNISMSSSLTITLIGGLLQALLFESQRNRSLTEIVGMQAFCIKDFIGIPVREARAPAITALSGRR